MQEPRSRNFVTPFLYKKTIFIEEEETASFYEVSPSFFVNGNAYPTPQCQSSFELTPKMTSSFSRKNVSYFVNSPPISLLFTGEKISPDYFPVASSRSFFM
jgi:hypothetical protein